jgi:hypothetical protein
MGSQVNRNLQAKYEKAKRQARVLASLEYSKPFYTIEHDRTPVSCDGVRVQRIPTGMTMARVLRQHF